MSEPHVLVVTSASAEPSAVVPVLAACEAAGMRVRAIDVGQAGAGGGGLSDRMRRALYGETAERRLRKEIDGNPPDVTIAFDPFAAQVLSLARDQAANPAPVVAVVTDLEPGAPWGQADADRYCAIDVETAVALGDAGVEEDRVLVVGPVGERAWADAATEDRAALRARFGAGERAVVVEVAGLGAELTGQLVMQLSLAELSERVTYLFDAAGDADAAAAVRRSVPALGLRAKLFGHSADAGRYWRAAEAVVARPRPRTVARTMLVGARLLALVDDEVPVGARTAAARWRARRTLAARGIQPCTSGLERPVAHVAAAAARRRRADHVVDVAWVVATERRASIEGGGRRRARGYAPAPTKPARDAAVPPPPPPGRARPPATSRMEAASRSPMAGRCPRPTIRRAGARPRPASSSSCAMVDARARGGRRRRALRRRRSGGRRRPSPAGRAPRAKTAPAAAGAAPAADRARPMRSRDPRRARARRLGAGSAPRGARGGATGHAAAVVGCAAERAGRRRTRSSSSAGRPPRPAGSPRRRSTTSWRR
ncbi:MAG: hypothetical protein HS111_16140 [Kofleriaceae bacterium]|nr:hypothetical protein [Kofleriaceae bacterium]